MTPQHPIEALASSGQIGLEPQMASGGQPALRAARNGFLLRGVDAFAESVLVAALLGELSLVLANVTS